MNLLHVDSSILGAASVSRQLSAAIVAAACAAHPGLEVARLDLARDPIGHLTGAHIAIWQGGAPETPALAEEVAAGNAALDAFLAADIVVIGAPMYNFGIPSQLKAWIDRLAIAGRTFRFTEHGPQGLAGGKRLIIASSRGGVYTDGAALAASDHQEHYLRAIFSLFGIPDIRFVRAEGLAVGEDQRRRALAAAYDAIAARTA